MGYSQNYNSKFITDKNIELTYKFKSKTIRLLDGTKLEGNLLITKILKEYLIGDKYNFIYFKAIKKGIILYCSIIGKFEISLFEAEKMIRIIMDAISHKYILTNSPESLYLSKAELLQASKRWNAFYEES